MHPDPVHRSRIFRGVGPICCTRSISHAHQNSVSGRGIKMGGRTVISSPKKETVPNIYCKGLCSITCALRVDVRTACCGKVSSWVSMQNKLGGAHMGHPTDNPTGD